MAIFTCTSFLCILMLPRPHFLCWPFLVLRGLWAFESIIRMRCHGRAVVVVTHFNPQNPDRNHCKMNWAGRDEGATSFPPCLRPWKCISPKPQRGPPGGGAGHRVAAVLGTPLWLCVGPHAPGCHKPSLVVSLACPG